MTFFSQFSLALLCFTALALIYLIRKTVNWLAGRTMIPTWLGLILIPGVLIGGSFFLDYAGARTPVEVLEKREIINTGKYDSWNRTLSIQIRYPSPRGLNQSSMALRCDAETFDSIRVGQIVEARILDFGQFFRFARLSNRSTMSAFTSWVANFFPPSPDGPYRQTNATVSHIKEVKEYNERSGRTILPYPYYVAELTFIPEGKRDSVVAVDIVDAASVPGLKKGDVRTVQYAVDIPRSAHIVGAQPGRIASNRFSSVGRLLAVAVGLLLILGMFLLLWQRLKRRFWGALAAKRREIGRAP